jgi:hypothetical protein
VITVGIHPCSKSPTTITILAAARELLAAAMNNNIKQEPPAVRVLPPTTTVVKAYYSAVSPFLQTPPPLWCQQEPSPFPIGMHQHRRQLLQASSSCISSGCGDQYSDMVQMAAAEVASWSGGRSTWPRGKGRSGIL